MLGVRRPSVTAAVCKFERRGLISGGRGVITISDRHDLRVTARGYHGKEETELKRLFAS
jgi:hypothetical protein